MLNKDAYLLEKAYLSISQPMASVPSDEEPLEQNDNMEMDGKVGVEVSGPEMEDEMGGCNCGGEECTCNSHNPEMELSAEDECDEDRMAVDNLNSVRQSAMKIAQYWEQGGHLETWQQQKLAIVMAYLEDIARALR